VNTRSLLVDSAGDCDAPHATTNVSRRGGAALRFPAPLRAGGLAIETAGDYRRDTPRRADAGQRGVGVGLGERWAKTIGLYGQSG
jgi:hypothetical protein